MAGDVAVKPCCAEWKAKYLKNEKNRKHLREALKLFEEKLAECEAHNSNLKKEYEELQVLADIEKEEKVKESAARASLENEISGLKSEILSLKQIESADALDKNEVKLLQGQVSEGEKEINRLKELMKKEKKKAESESKKAELERVKDSAARASLENEISRLKSEILSLKQIESAEAQDKNEVKLLKSQVSEGEKEINRLKELIEKEKKRADSESKKAEVEKKKAAEARKNVKAEIGKADEERKRANNEAEKADNYRVQMDALKKAAEKANSDLASERIKLEAAIKELEAEKEKVVRERECANSEKAKADEQRKLAEANRKKSNEEKWHAESLSLQLVESRKRIDELQAELNEIKCSRELHISAGGQSDNNRNAVASKEISIVEENKRFEIEKQKVVKEKKRAGSEMVNTEKHKKLAEVNWKKAMDEKSRADNLSRQLDEAKRKIEELSTRHLVELSAVDFAKGAGAESLKVKDLKKQLKFEKLQRKHANKVVKLEKRRYTMLQQELGCLKFDFDQFSRRMEMLNRSFSYSAEGIDDPKKTWNIIEKQQLSMKNLEGNIQRGIDGPNPGFDASDPFKEAMQHTEPYPPLSGENCTGSVSGIDSKLESPRGPNRKMLQSSAINSRSASFSDGQLVGSQEKGAFSITTPAILAEENVQPTMSNLSNDVTIRKCNENIAVVAENSVRSPVRAIGIGKVNEHSRKRKRITDAVESIENLYFEGKKFHQKVEDNLSVLHSLLNKQIEKTFEERLHKKKKAGFEEKLVMRNCGYSNEPKKAVRNDIEAFGANVCRKVSKNVNEQMETVEAISEGLSDSHNSNMMSFGQVTDFNFLKLLELDNDADEERYRRAREMPLSPTLPEIQFQDVEASDADTINPLIKESICQRLSNKNGGHINSFGRQGLKGDGSGSDNSLAMENACELQVQDTGTEVVSRCEPVFRFGNALSSVGDHTLKCYAVFSNTEDSSSIYRICNASRTYITQSSLAIQREWMVREILLVLETEEKLLPKEKVRVFFSLLLLNFSIASSRKFGTLNWDSNTGLDSFAQHMCSVMSDAEGRRIFLEFGGLDESLSLMEDFLIHGRVVVSNDASSNMMVECHSGVNFLLQLEDIHISSRPALPDELVAGAIVLSSICAAFDQIDFICETSYNILQNSSLNRLLVLTMLHVFAYLGGEKFFNFRNSNSVTVMKSIVTFLEGRRSSESADYCIPSESNSPTGFRPCVKCPFSEDAVSVDSATSLLLERLQSNNFLGTVSQEVIELDNLNSTLSLCDLTDLLSLVELVAHNMSWEWVSVKVVPQLLKILESCKAENVRAGIMVLLGQLGRLGVDAVGKEDKGVEYLRHELSAFLCGDAALNAGLPTQIATVTSLLGLMSLDFRTVIQCDTNPPVIACQLDPEQSIKKWYSLLSKKQQDLSFSLLHTASVDKNETLLNCENGL